MKSKLYSYSKEEIKSCIEESTSVTEVMRKLYMRNVGGNRDTFFKVIESYELQSELLSLKQRQIEESKKRIKKIQERRNLTEKELLCENSKAGRDSIKKYIIKNDLIEYKCRDCGNDGCWNNRDIILQLEHINGVHNDNRIDNLCFLCPNCHSQTETFAGRNNKSNKKEIIEPTERSSLKEKISYQNSLKRTLYVKKEYLSPEEKYKSNIANRKLSTDDIKYILENKHTLSKLKMSKMFEVSDKTIAKIIKNNGYIIQV